MTRSDSHSQHTLPFALALGVLGGGALVMTEILVPGRSIMLAYGALVLASLALLRVACWSSYWDRFQGAFLAFMVATVLVYVFIGTFGNGANILEFPFLGHVWRMGLMAAIGGVLSAGVAYIAGLGRLTVAR